MGRELAEHGQALSGAAGPLDVTYAAVEGADHNMILTTSEALLFAAMDGEVGGGKAAARM